MIESLPDVDKIPISGGWGYGFGYKSVVIENTKLFKKEFVQKLFIEKRIYFETVYFPNEQVRMYNMKFKILSQNFYDEDYLKKNGFEDRLWETFRVLVTGHYKKEMEYLKKIFEENNGFKDNKTGFKNYMSEYEKKLVGYENSYYFDVTNFH